MKYLHLAKHLKSCLLVLYFKMWLSVYEALLLQEILFCTVAVTADIQGKDKGDVLANRLNGPTK